MAITVSKYTAHGPFDNIYSVPAQSGVYIVLGSMVTGYSVIDVGESQNVWERLACHDREDCWKRQGARLYFAFIPANQNERMLIESELRAQYRPVCGIR